MLSCVDDEKSTRRAPSDAEVAADAAIRAARIQALATVVAGSIQARGMVRAARLTAGAAFLAACLAGACGLSGVGLGGYLASEAARRGAQSDTSPGRPDPSVAPVASATNTFDAANAPHGTFLYKGPFGNGHDMQPTASTWNGDPLRIVCQEQHGRTIRDGSTGKASAVWNKLDNGNWIPTMYTNLTEKSALSEIPPCTYR
jgi:hypothetical protein